MEFQWSHYLDLAQSIYLHAGATSDEAALRCVISRAYYAAYGTAADFLRAEGENIPKESTHRVVSEIFQRYHSDDARYDIGTRLKEISTKRKWADYDNPYPASNLQNDADDVLGEAEVIIDSINHLTPRSEF